MQRTNADLIVFRSKPFKLKIEKSARVEWSSWRTVPAPKQNRKSKLLLPDYGTVKVVCGQYNKSFHSFVAPDSAAGQLLLMDWQAVPGLLDSLKAKQLTDHQKGWWCCRCFTQSRARRTLLR